VREPAEVVSDPEVMERGTLVPSAFGERSDVKVIGAPIKLSSIAPEEIPHRAPPQLGEHTDEVLASIGISAEEIARLRADGAI